jgi:nucleotide-binding universal stress UspA family protein
MITMTTTETKPRIIVGLDGSPGSEEALRWATQYADLTGANVDAVIAWSLPEIYAYVSRDYAADARAALTHSVERALGPDGMGRVTLHVVEAHPAAALTSMCSSAQLLVVGKHGHGGFAGMTMGSVSQHCVRHACCPVVVVPSSTSR